MLEDAVANHRSWFARGRELVELDGVSVYLGGPSAVLAFPRADGDLAEAVERARASGATEIGCWAHAPDAALGLVLHDLGFQDGWQPHWMGIDPRAPIDAGRHPVEETFACADGLPYGSPNHGAMAAADVRHFVVRAGDQIVGHSVLNVDGSTGGVFDMGVALSARRQGYGDALTRATVLGAREAGCTSVTLNATGEGGPMYRRCGFASLGLGMTWWLFPGRERG